MAWFRRSQHAAGAQFYHEMSTCTVWHVHNNAQHCTILTPVEVLCAYSCTHHDIRGFSLLPPDLLAWSARELTTHFLYQNLVGNSWLIHEYISYIYKRYYTGVLPLLVGCLEGRLLYKNPIPWTAKVLLGISCVNKKIGWLNKIRER